MSLAESDAPRRHEGHEVFRMSAQPGISHQRLRLRRDAEALRRGETPVRKARGEQTPEPRRSEPNRSTRCKEFSPWWKNIIASGIRMAQVLASPRVSAEIAAARDAECERCSHTSRDAAGRLYCECCGCPQWRAAVTTVKNQHAAWACPRNPPAFGPYDSTTKSTKGTK